MTLILFLRPSKEIEPFGAFGSIPIGGWRRKKRKQYVIKSRERLELLRAQARGESIDIEIPEIPPEIYDRLEKEDEQTSSLLKSLFESKVAEKLSEQIQNAILEEQIRQGLEEVERINEETQRFLELKIQSHQFLELWREFQEEEFLMFLLVMDDL